MRISIFLGVFIMLGTLQAKVLEEGIYKMTVTFAQGQDFVDYLSIEESGEASFTVPGNFTSKIKIQGSSKSFYYTLKAIEGGQKVELNFKGGSSNDGRSLKGQIFEPSNNSVIGKFKGEKLYESKQDCGDYFIPY